MGEIYILRQERDEAYYEALAEEHTLETAMEEYYLKKYGEPDEW